MRDALKNQRGNALIVVMMVGTIVAIGFAGIVTSGLLVEQRAVEASLQQEAADTLLHAIERRGGLAHLGRPLRPDRTGVAPAAKRVRSLNSSIAAADSAAPVAIASAVSTSSSCQARPKACTQIVSWSTTTQLGSVRVSKVSSEPSPAGRMYQHGIRRALDEFRPDLVFQIDHLRHEHGQLSPPGLPFACWIQDHLPHLQTPVAGRSGRARSGYRCYTALYKTMSFPAVCI